MRKHKIVALAVAAITMCGCTKDLQTSSVPVYTLTQSSSTSSSRASTSTESEVSEVEITSSSSNETPSFSSNETPSFSSSEDDKEIPYEERSSTGVVWNPLSTNLTYDFNSAGIIKALEENYGKSGADLGYKGEWCAEVISDLLIKDGYRISKQLNPCDVTIQLLNKGYAHFYCFRQENFDSLVQYGLKKSAQSRVIMTDREDFTPQRGDFVCFLWNEENDVYNWSHIGMIAEDYDGTVLRTIEGNIGVAEFPDDPRIRTVDGREREYNETVIGIIRLDK